MNASIKLALIVTAVSIALPQPAIGKSQGLSKQLAGAWQLDLGKSHFSSADYTPKSDRRTYSVAGNRLTMRSKGVNADGKAMNWSYSATLDGKSARVVGNPNADHIALTRVSDHEFKSETRLKGKPSASSSTSLSQDGKELTIHRSVLVAKGGPTDDTMVFERTK